MVFLARKGLIGILQRCFFGAHAKIPHASDTFAAPAFFAVTIRVTSSLDTDLFVGLRADPFHTIKVLRAVTCAVTRFRTRPVLTTEMKTEQNLTLRAVSTGAIHTVQALTFVVTRARESIVFVLFAVVTVTDGVSGLVTMVWGATLVFITCTLEANVSPVAETIFRTTLAVISATGLVAFVAIFVSEVATEHVTAAGIFSEVWATTLACFSLFGAILGCILWREGLICFRVRSR
jgi:hypothetical protein